MADASSSPTSDLCKAAEGGNLARVVELLAAGVDPSAADEEGVTPLIHAAQHDRADVVKALLDAGAPWNALDSSGRCAGDYAMDAGYQASFDILLNAGTVASQSRYDVTCSLTPPKARATFSRS